MDMNLLIFKVGLEHMYLVPGDTKSTGPQGVVEVHLGTASKPAPWTYGPYITAK